MGNKQKMNKLLKNKTKLFICRKRNNQIWKPFAENSPFDGTANCHLVSQQIEI